MRQTPLVLPRMHSALVSSKNSEEMMLTVVEEMTSTMKRKSASAPKFQANESKEKMEIFSKSRKLSQKEIIEKCRKIDKKIQIKYPVFKDLRERGYVVKTALKFGADFRVYEKGAKPGEKHAKWIVFTEHESNRLTWHEFSAKNRVAHSTKKNLLLAIVDEEGDISYYEVRWLKP